MRVLVTGATGNVGSAVIAALEQDPETDDVIGLARRIPVVPLTGRARYVRADVSVDDLAMYLDGVDVVIHLAWHFQPTHAPEVTWRNNAVGSERVFQAAAAAGASAVIYASSVGAYSPVPRGDDDPRDERWPTHSSPTSCYGREKAYVERILDTFEARRPSIRVVRMRPSFIFGRAAASEQRRIFAGPFLPNSLLRRGVLPVLPFPRGLRFQAVHVDDIAAAYAAAVRREVHGPFNLAAEPVLRGSDFARLLDTRLLTVPPALARAAIAVAWHFRLAPAEPTLFDLAMRVPLLDTTRAGTELDWRPRHSSCDAIDAFLDGVRDGAGGPTRPLAADSWRERVRELASGVGGRDVD